MKNGLYSAGRSSFCFISRRFILIDIGNNNHQKWQPAGLWIRIQAFVIDYLVILAYLALFTAIMWIINSISPDISQALFDDPLSGQSVVFLFFTLPVILYFALFDSSLWQATPGKRRRNLRVIRLNGESLDRKRALGREILKFIPWELAHTCIWQIRFSPEEPSPMITVGFILVWILIGMNIISLLISPTHQTLYDRLSGSLVVTGLRTKNSDSPTSL